MKEEHLRLRDHDPEELAYLFQGHHGLSNTCSPSAGASCGAWPTARITTSSSTMEHSGENMEYLDPVTNESYIPYCIEPSLGVDRVALAFLCDAYDEEELEGGDTRVVLHLHPGARALSRRPCCPCKRTSWATRRAKYMPCSPSALWWITTKPAPSASATAGRTRSGTPLCITVDFDTLEDRQSHRARPRYHAARTRRHRRPRRLYRSEDRFLKQIGRAAEILFCGAPFANPLVLINRGLPQYRRGSPRLVYGICF